MFTEKGILIGLVDFDFIHPKDMGGRHFIECPHSEKGVEDAAGIAIFMIDGEEFAILLSR